MVAANAAAIKQHSQVIGEVYNNPVIAIEKIAQAQNDLLEAMDLADRLQQKGIESARENIAKLSELSAEMHQRAERTVALPASADAEIKSIEA